MSDLETQIRDALHEDASRAPLVPRMPESVRPRVRRRQAGTIASAALAAVAVVAVSVVAIGALDRDRITLPPRTTPSAVVSMEDHLGWPDTNRNPPGVYSWGSRCAGQSCNIGFMHNGYGSGDVEIRIQAVTNPEGVVGREDATAVTIAGYDGFHRQVVAPNGGRIEEWVIDIEGTTIVIRLEARPGTSQADLAEAYSIIASMRAQGPRDDPWLLFTITTNDWDSG